MFTLQHRQRKTTMDKTHSLWWRGIWLCSILLLFGTLGPLSGSVHAAGTTVTPFYTTTRAAYDAWAPKNDAAAPPRTTAFHTGTKVVAFYFMYHGAQPKKSHFRIIVHAASGATVVTVGPNTLPYVDDADMTLVAAPNHAPYPDGVYHADLMVDGRHIARTVFTVGTQRAPSSSSSCQSSDVVAACIEPSVLRLHVSLPHHKEAEGTGFVMQSDSTGTYLLTNKHVVAGAIAAEAISPGGHIHYPVLAIQVNNAPALTAGDLAVVKLPRTSLRPLAWVDSGHLRMLQQVISIGYGDAFDLSGPPTVTEGVISALHRDLDDGYGSIWIQHQSFINPGNSGGPLLDTHFAVVGINTLSLNQTQGMFFAIPSNTARQTAQVLISQLQTP
jgi:S1-C subfamily serine protease